MIMEYKGFKVDDNKVDEYVDKLDCSIAEACELILEEQGKIEQSDEVKKAIAEKEKSGRHYEKSGKPRKKTEKVRKVNTTKLKLFEIISQALADTVEITEQKTETALDFTYDGKAYTLRLVEHRKPKE